MFVLNPIYMTFFGDPISRSTGASAGFFGFTFILSMCVVWFSFIYNLLLMILGIFFGLIFSGFPGILLGIISAFQRFIRDVTWAYNFFENSYNYESVLWNILLSAGILFNLLTICLFYFLLRNK